MKPHPKRGVQSHPRHRPYGGRRVHRFHPSPNLLLIGGPKTGTTSLMHWLASHEEIHHPWKNESHFLMAGPAEFPTSPIHPKGTAILAPRADLDGAEEHRWVMDKSTFHLYSPRALEAVSEHLPDARVIITLRHPVDLMLSMHQEHRKRLIEYDTDQATMIELSRNQSFLPDEDIPETYSFLQFPRLKAPTLRWIEELGERVRVVPLSSIATDPLATTNTILSWLGANEMPPGTKLPRYNERGQMNPAGWAKMLRTPPTFLSGMAKILLPTKRLRRAVLDPIRSPGFKPVSVDSSVLDDKTRHELERAFAEEIEFQDNLTSYIDPSLIVGQG